MSNIRIVIIGAGNVATNLAKVFKSKLSADVHIHNRTENSAKQLADKLQTTYSFDINELPIEADLYVISVSDDAISELSQNAVLKDKINNKLVVHTAGSISSEVLSSLSANYGVFYPLQTFSKFKQLDFNSIPLCLEANSGFNYNTLSKYAFQISDDVRKISSEQRKYIHLAAVFANNFSNRMFSIAEKLLKEQDLDFDILIPLINETVDNIQKKSPNKVQTGPAIRNDEEVLNKHSELLSENEKLQKIYNLISENINS